MPAFLLAGSSTLIIVNLDDGLIPSESKSISLTGFFLALITFGKLIFLGVFRRESVVSTAGRDKFNVSNPPSTSRTAVNELSEIVISLTLVAWEDRVMLPAFGLPDYNHRQ